MNFIYVGLGGFLGAVARYSVGLYIPSTGFPWATLAVNCVGCGLIGFLASRSLTPQLSLFLMTGILGGFTTFSAFGLETVRLVQNNQLGLAAVNIIANLTVGVGSVYFFFVNKL